MLGRQCTVCWSLAYVSYDAMQCAKVQAIAAKGAYGNLDLEALARLAVKDSYRRNDLLNESAVQKLANDLLNCEKPHTSPFGKPTFSEIDWNEWQKRFGSE